MTPKLKCYWFLPSVGQVRPLIEKQFIGTHRTAIDLQINN